MSSYFTSHHFSPHWMHHDGKGKVVNPDDERVAKAACMAKEEVQRSSEPDNHHLAGLEKLAHFLHAYSWHYNRGGQRSHEVHETIHPRFDLVETATGYMLYGELPGLNREEVTVDVDDTHCTVGITGILSRPEPMPKKVALSQQAAASGTGIGVVHLEANTTAVQAKEETSSAVTTASTGAPASAPASAPAPPPEDGPVQEGKKSAEFGELEENKEPELDVHWHVLERKVGKFHRVFMLPPGLADTAATTAYMANGLVTVVIPKKKGMEGKREAPKRKVPVERGWVNPYGGMLISP